MPSHHGPSPARSTGCAAEVDFSRSSHKQRSDWSQNSVRGKTHAGNQWLNNTVIGLASSLQRYVREVQCLMFRPMRDPALRADDRGLLALAIWDDSSCMSLNRKEFYVGDRPHSPPHLLTHTGIRALFESLSRIHLTYCAKWFGRPVSCRQHNVPLRCWSRTWRLARVGHSEVLSLKACCEAMQQTGKTHSDASSTPRRFHAFSCHLGDLKQLPRAMVFTPWFGAMQAPT